MLLQDATEEEFLAAGARSAAAAAAAAVVVVPAVEAKNEKSIFKRLPKKQKLLAYCE